jgi:biopolymer transport protein ExbD
MAKFKNDEEGIYNINIVPFVDIVLVLLVITMLTAPTMYQSSIRLELPKTFQATASSKITFRLSLNREGELYLDNKKISPAEIPTLYEKARSIDPEVDAIMNADKSISHGQVMQIIDVLRQAGMRNIAMGASDK